MDIDRELEKIIDKYNLGDVYPKYKKIRKARSIIKRMVISWGQKGKVACIATNSMDADVIKHYSQRNDNIEFFVCKKNDFQKNKYSEAFDMYFLTNVHWDEFDAIYIVSLEGSSFVKHFLRNLSVSHFFLYDLFELEGLFFSDDWYQLLPDKSMDYWSVHFFESEKNEYYVMEIVDRFEEYRNCTCELLKRIQIRKAFFMSLFVRDFIMAEKCLNCMDSSFSFEHRAWGEINELLSKIRSVLKNYSKRDIVLFWTDAVCYDDIAKIPFLDEKKEAGVCFDNIFTPCPYTNPTFKALMCAKMPIDDEGYLVKVISGDNSVVFNDLLKSEYQICVIGKSWNALDRRFYSDVWHNEFEPTSIRLWDLWRNIVLRGNSKTFYMVHALQESHSPNLWVDMGDYGVAHEYIRYSHACKYLDLQYRFYINDISDEVTKIYMTDHGKGQYQTRFHTYMVIEASNYEPKHIEEMCSYIDFHKIMRRIIAHLNIDKYELTRARVNVQDLDYCYGPMNYYIVKNKQPLQPYFFGYNGVIDRTHIYLKFTDGREWFVARDKVANEPNLLRSYIYDEAEVIKYREFVKPYKLSEGLKKFARYTPYMHELYIRGKEKNQKKYKVLNDWIRGFDDFSIAIRMGGEDGYSFYNYLDIENRKKIACIVDVNPNCLCRCIGLPIISTVDDLSDDVKNVLFSTKQYLDVLRKEAEGYNKHIRVLDPYKYLLEHGIMCKKDIAGYDLDDYDVGFPFQDFE